MAVETKSTNRKKVLATDTLAPAARAALLERDNIDLATFPNLATREEFLEVLAREAPVAAFALGPTQVSDDQIAAAQGLEVVARIGVGFDAIDIPALNRNGVPLMTAGTANSPSVAEHALYMMMWLARRALETDAIVKEGRWTDRMGAVPFDLFEKSVLIIGFGRIGTRTAKRCAAMDMTVHVYDPYVDDAVIAEAGYTPVGDLDAAVAAADFVSIHCPKNPETIGMFGSDRIGRMKQTAYLVNTARGGIVDETALFKALENRQIAGAGLDVFSQEPVDPDNPLLKRDDVITSPHMAGVTVEALHRMGLAAVSNILSVFDGDILVENVINKEVLDRR
jgi:D-3-phosphoglycerate dehydrogenase